MKTDPNISREGGQAAIMAVIFFVFISLVLMANMWLVSWSHLSLSLKTAESIQSLVVADAGAEDIIYRVRNNLNYPDTYQLVVGDFQAEVEFESLTNRDFRVHAEGWVNESVRKITRDLYLGAGLSFLYGIQAGEGGVILQQSSSVEGNIYSSGPVLGSDSLVDGSVVSAGLNGLLRDLRVDDLASAYQIEDTEIGGSGYGYDITGTTGDLNDQGGHLCAENLLENSSPEFACPESPYTYEIPPEEELPITDEIIDDWKMGVEDEEVVACSGTYVIDSDTVLGPTKFTCDVEVSGQTEITLLGNLWVEGDLNLKGSGNNSLHFKIDDSLEEYSLVVVADGQIHLHNHVNFTGTSESDSSYIMLVSTKEGVEDPAIDINVATVGDLLVYAKDGEVLMRQSSQLKEVTGYRIRLRNTAQVIYETGLANTFFASGPGGHYYLARWRETD